MNDSARSATVAAGQNGDHGHLDDHHIVSVRLLRCPRLMSEAVVHEIQQRSTCVLADETADHIDGNDVIDLVYCDSEASWEELAANVRSRSRGSVAIVTRLDLDDFARALALGAAGVVHTDMSSSIIVDVVLTAARGEAVLPAFAAHALGAHWLKQQPSSALNPYESELLAKLKAGTSTRELARQRNFSERTIRRHLQSLYLKLGVTGRVELIDSGLDETVGATSSP